MNRVQSFVRNSRPKRHPVTSHCILQCPFTRESSGSGPLLGLSSLTPFFYVFSAASLVISVRYPRTNKRRARFFRARRQYILRVHTGRANGRRTRATGSRLITHLIEAPPSLPQRQQRATLPLESLFLTRSTFSASPAQRWNDRVEEEGGKMSVEIMTRGNLSFSPRKYI